jgi:hypothetical protein
VQVGQQARQPLGLVVAQQAVDGVGVARAQQALPGHGIGGLTGRDLRQGGALLADGGPGVVVAVVDELLLLVVGKG